MVALNQIIRTQNFKNMRAIFLRLTENLITYFKKIKALE